MEQSNEDVQPITRELVPERDRAFITTHQFGALFDLFVEPVVYNTAQRLAEGYDGGYWHFYELSNDGFYMVPASKPDYQVHCDNGWTGELSADAFGITVCLYAYSHCSFIQDEIHAKVCALHYHRLRDFMVNHAEVKSILRATD